MADNRKNDPAEIIATMRDVTVTFDGYVTRTIARVSLELRRGEVLGLLGARGAGKSTLLRLMAGRLRATEGAVKVFGWSPRWSSIKARIGYVPGKSDLEHPQGFFSRLFRRKGESSQAGTRGVPGLTQAIMGGRDLVVLDEPFADAGPAEKSELKTLIRELAGRGKTIIVSGNSLVDAKDICDRLLILHEGRVQAKGSLQELLRAPGALRFLAPILPPELAGRIVEMVCNELAVKNVPAETTPVSAEKPKEKPAIPSPEEHLTHLIRPAENTPTAEQSPSRPPGAIDHDKLEGLTKPTKPE